MRSPFAARAALIIVVSMLLGMVASWQPAAAQAQTQPAGTSTLGYTANWEYIPEASNPQVVVLSHVTIQATTFVFGEIVEPDATTMNAADALEEVADLFVSELDAGTQQVVAEGTLNGDTPWKLYGGTLDGVPLGTLVTANTTTVVGSVTLSVLGAPAGSFDLALTDAQADITLNGAPLPIAQLNPAELHAALEGGQPVGGQTPAAGTTPAAPGQTPTPGGLTLPPLGGQTPAATTPAAGTTPAAPGETPTPGGLVLPPLGGQTPQAAETPAAVATTPAAAATTPAAQTGGQSQVIAGSTVTYGPSWTYDAEGSSPEELGFFDHATHPSVFYAFRAVPDSSATSLAALQSFIQQYMTQLGATNVVLAAEEALPSGKAWSLHTGELSGNPLAVLAYGDIGTAPGQFRLELLFGTPEQVVPALADAQAEVQVDATAAFAELDVTRVATLLGQPVPSTTTTTTTTTTNPTPTVATTTIGTTPTPGTTTTTTTTGQTVTISGVTVGYSPAWTYEESASRADAIAIFTSATNPGSIFAYTVGPGAAGDPLQQLQQFVREFFTTFQADNVTLVREEALPSGHAWSLHTATRDGQPMVILMVADATTVPGELRTEVILAPATSFDAVLAEVQGTITVNGQPSMVELDPAVVGALA